MEKLLCAQTGHHGVKMTKFTNPGFDPSTFSNRSQEIEKLNDVSEPEETIRVSLGAGTENDYFDMSDLSVWSSQYNYEPGATNDFTIKIYATWQDDGTLPSAITQWVDVSNLFIGAASLVVSAGATASGYWSANLAGCKYIRVECTISGVASDSAYTLYKNARVI